MDQKTLIAKTRTLTSRDDLFNLLNEIKADLLGDGAYPFTLKQFLILCNPKNSNRKRYYTFDIPKKSGGVRRICAPCGNLKWIQICLNEIFKALYTPSPYAMGFTKGRSIIDNARMHTNQNYVFNIDLKDFFPSIDQARVWKRLQLAPFNFNAQIASVIAGFCSIKMVHHNYDESVTNFVLPQGAPTSPLLTNAVCDTLDRRLHGLAKRFGLHYSRYADDITFSSMHNVYQPESIFRKELERIITDQHFTINENKTRLNHCSKRQEVTGLTVGAKINVSRKYVKDIRAILHIWEKYGLNAAYATFFPRYKSEKCHLHDGEVNLVNVISGKLCFLKMVKGKKDPVYTKLNEQFLRLSQDSMESERQKNIGYIFTTTKNDFEKKLGVTIDFASRKYDNKTYGSFYFQDRHFFVGVSKNLDIENLSNDTQISLVQTFRDPNFHSTAPYRTHMFYLLHKPFRGYKAEKQESDTNIVSSELKEFVINLANTYPGLGLNDELGIIESHNQENLLKNLVESNFDLSILP